MSSISEKTENPNVLIIKQELDVTELNTSYRLLASTSMSESESDLSFTLSVDRELESYINIVNNDELPAFEIRLISPMGRSPSPIDNEMAAEIDVQTNNVYEHITPSPHHNDPEYVALQDINAQIRPPNDNEDLASNSLETIYEGVFLNTPPRKRLSLLGNSRSCTSIIEKVALNRLNFAKENPSPLLLESPQSPLGQQQLKTTQETESRVNSFQQRMKKIYTK